MVLSNLLRDKKFLVTCIEVVIEQHIKLMEDNQVINFNEEKSSRLDAFLAKEISDLSRSRIQALIKSGDITVNGQNVKPKYSLELNDQIEVTIPAPEPYEVKAEDLPLEIIHEDSDLVVINKAPGMVVHPAVGSPDGTVVNALLHHCKGELAGIGGVERPGIVHRLDKDTSGCLIVAKRDVAHQELVRQFAERETKKFYLCVTERPLMKKHDTVFTNIGRHPVHRQKMAVLEPGAGKPAITDYYVLHSAEDGTSLVLCVLHTGRTHQIRVHMKHAGAALLGDPIYANIPRQVNQPGRLMLHAWRLGVNHPLKKDWLQSEAPLPPEYLPWVDALEDGVLDSIRDGSFFSE